MLTIVKDLFQTKYICWSENIQGTSSFRIFTIKGGHRIFCVHIFTIKLDLAFCGPILSFLRPEKIQSGTKTSQIWTVPMSMCHSYLHDQRWTRFILRSFFHDQIKPSFLWTYFVFLRPEKIQLWTRDWLNVDQFKKEKNHATSHDFFKYKTERKLLIENLQNY